MSLGEWLGAQFVVSEIIHRTDLRAEFFQAPQLLRFEITDDARVTGRIHRRCLWRQDSGR